ncbi:TPA: hypothetical protein ACPZHU_004541 [Yersinia enterocolitica]
MPLKIECQKVDTWKKKIIRDDLKGHTYFCQQGGAVFVTASIDHQSIWGSTPESQKIPSLKADLHNSCEKTLSKLYEKSNIRCIA